MNKQLLLATLVTSATVLATGALADPAVYRDNHMTIASGALIADAELQYYRDIVMTTDAEGRLLIVSATRLPLVHIDSVTPVVVESSAERSVSLTIVGYKSVPCVQLEDVAISRKDSVFTLLVAETVMGPAQSCIAIIDPFSIDVALDVSGLEPGVYKVEVNGKETEFELEQEEPLPVQP